MPAQVPNCTCERPSACPSTGNRKRATAFSRKTVPSATDISASAAPVARPTAAIADPPQMAVPADSSIAVFDSIHRTRRSHAPSRNVSAIVAAAISRPWRAATRTASRLVPNPRRTTDAWSSGRLSRLRRRRPGIAQGQGEREADGQRDARRGERGQGEEHRQDEEGGRDDGGAWGGHPPNCSGSRNHNSNA